MNEFNNYLNLHTVGFPLGLISCNQLTYIPDYMASRPKGTSRKFNIFVSRVFANHWFQHFTAKFHQYFQNKNFILCFELNILDDLKIVDYRKFSLMQQTVQASFLCLFLTIIYCMGMLYIQDFSYNLFVFIILAVVYSSCSN